ncbi:MAG: hypothetical protein N7Q72_04700, partial [Spiroplasma sp. Tabriz.8]|nr:hypothetical protein [Spiroplasma sp. Tabriz.8]
MKRGKTWEKDRWKKKRERKRRKEKKKKKKKKKKKRKEKYLGVLGFGVVSWVLYLNTVILSLIVKVNC